MLNWDEDDSIIMKRATHLAEFKADLKRFTLIGYVAANEILKNEGLTNEDIYALNSVKNYLNFMHRTFDDLWEFVTVEPLSKDFKWEE